jgi:hypothetical protein
MMSSESQLTLVALYGKKEEPFRSFLLDCQNFLTAFLGTCFKPYEPAQVHATIIGLESLPGKPAINSAFVRLRQREMPMDIAGFLEFIRRSELLPFQVRIGGFSDADYSFTSRNLRPFERSFGLRGGKPAVIGWPMEDTTPNSCSPPMLDSLRRAAQRFGILHGYHALPDDVDNDFFFRIGLVDADESPEKIRAVEQSMREYLAGRPPVRLVIRLSDLRLVAYTDDRLPLGGSKVFSIQDPAAVSALLIRQ